MLGSTQKFQHAGVIACRFGALLPSHDESFHRGKLYIIMYCHSYQ